MESRRGIVGKEDPPVLREAGIPGEDTLDLVRSLWGAQSDWGCCGAPQDHLSGSGVHCRFFMHPVRSGGL